MGKRKARQGMYYEHASRPDGCSVALLQQGSSPAATAGMIGMRPASRATSSMLSSETLQAHGKHHSAPADAGVNAVQGADSSTAFHCLEQADCISPEGRTADVIVPCRGSTCLPGTAPSRPALPA